MSDLIKAALRSAEHPEYGEVTVSFPIADDQYDQTIERLAALGIGDALERDCRIDGVDSSCAVLDRLVGQVVQIDALDYLAKRLDAFDAYEAAQFQGMAEKWRLSDLADLINLTFCCQQATVITDFSDLEQVGRNHRLALRGGAMSRGSLQTLSGSEEACALIRNGDGTVTPYGVVYDNGVKLERVYNGRQFPGQLYKDSLLVLEIAPNPNLDMPQAPEYLCLPASEQQIVRTMLRAGFDHPDEADWDVEFYTLTEFVVDVLRPEHEDIFALNEVCGVIGGLDAAEVKKLDAAVLLAEPEGADELCRLAENLDQFEFVAGVQTLEDYGRYLIQESGHFDYDENLEQFYDYRLCGEIYSREDGGEFTSLGYVTYCGAAPLEELLRAQRQEFQMGGMA